MELCFYSRYDLQWNNYIVCPIVKRFGTAHNGEMIDENDSTCRDD